MSDVSCASTITNDLSLNHANHRHYILPLISNPIILQYDAKKITLKVLVATIDAQWEGMGDVGSVRYEPALLPPCPTIRVLSYSN